MEREGDAAIDLTTERKQKKRSKKHKSQEHKHKSKSRKKDKKDRDILQHDGDLMRISSPFNTQNESAQHASSAGMRSVDHGAGAGMNLNLTQTPSFQFQAHTGDHQTPHPITKVTPEPQHPTTLPTLNTLRGPVKPAFKIKDDTIDDLERIARVYDHNNDGLFTFVEVKQIVTKYVHDLKTRKGSKVAGMASMETARKNHDGGTGGRNRSSSVSDSGCSISYILGICISLSCIFLVGVASSYFAMFWGTNGLVLPVAQIRDRLPTTVIHAALRTTDGKQVTTSATLTRLITAPVALLDVPQALMQRMEKISFLVQEDGPSVHWDLVNGNVLGVAHEGAGRLTISLSRGNVVVDINQSGPNAWYMPFDVTGATWPPPIRLHPVLMASELTPAMLEFDPTKLASCPVGMVSEPGNNALATNCHCPAGYTGSIWTGCARAGLRAPTYAPAATPSIPLLPQSYESQANKFQQRCLPDVTYEHAQNFCHLLSARLCTHVEMQNLVETISQVSAARVHEHKFADMRCDDGTGFWTSSECQGTEPEWAYYVLVISNGMSLERKCAPTKATDTVEAEKRGVTCCYDTQDMSASETGFWFDVDNVAPALLSSGVFAEVNSGLST